MTMKRVGTLTLLRVLRPFIKNIPPRQLRQLYRSFKNDRFHWFNNQVRINTFFPPYPSQSYDRFFRSIIERKRTPYQAYVAVTSACPYQCPHCSYGKRPPGHLSRNDLLKIISELKTLGTSIIGFTGGEPLLSEDLEEIITAAAPEMTTVLFTTGYRLDDSRAKKLLKAGIGSVVVSIESSNPQQHDALRGKSGSFSEAVTAIKACTNTRIYTAIETIGTRQKIRDGELEKIYETGCRLNVEEIRILSPVAAGRWTGCTDVMLQPEELSALQEFHAMHNRQKNGPCVATGAYIESETMFGCTGGYHHIYIDAAGEVCPCDLTPLSFGNIKKESLQDIWDKMAPYFPQPRPRCLMSTIAANITSDRLPLAPDESIRIMNGLAPPADLPVLFQRLYK